MQDCANITPSGPQPSLTLGIARTPLNREDSQFSPIHSPYYYSLSIENISVVYCTPSERIRHDEVPI